MGNKQTFLTLSKDLEKGNQALDFSQKNVNKVNICYCIVLILLQLVPFDVHFNYIKHNHLPVIQISILSSFQPSPRCYYSKAIRMLRGLVYDAVYNHMLHRLSQLSAGSHGRLLCAPEFQSVANTCSATTQAIQSHRLHYIDKAFICAA